MTGATDRWGDLVGFLKAGLTQPRRVSAVLPSGRALAKLITRGIGPETGPVIELGPGTGVFTAALLARGVRASELALVELDACLAARLQQRYPDACVLCMDATHLATAALFNGTPAGAAISGLPLLSLSRREVTEVLQAAFAHLAEGAAFYQFTYGLGCPVPAKVLETLALQAVCEGRTLANVPPAAVYRITRRVSAN